jgi:hypothetical protein
LISSREARGCSRKSASPSPDSVVIVIDIFIFCVGVGRVGVGVCVREGGEVVVVGCVVVVVVVAFIRGLVFIHVFILLLAVSLGSDGGSLLAHYALKLVKLLLFR